jgi:hypothetical protein
MRAGHLGGLLDERLVAALRNLRARMVATG